MTSDPFQFTLRNLFVATAYFAGGCAVVALLDRAWHRLAQSPTAIDALVLLFGPFAVAAFVGGGIGALCGKTLTGASRGFEYLLVFHIVAITVAALVYAAWSALVF